MPPPLRTQARRGLLLILSSPSGPGKSTLARKVMAWDPTIRFSVSATTRAPRPGEEDGRDYFFRSRADFEEMARTGEMLEHAEVFGNLYGSPRAPVEAAMRDGRDTLVSRYMKLSPNPNDVRPLAAFEAASGMTYDKTRIREQMPAFIEWYFTETRYRR